MARWMFFSCPPNDANREEVEVGAMFCSAVGTLGRCRRGLLDRSRLLAQLLLRLQDRVLKLGLLVDVAAKNKQTQI